MSGSGYYRQIQYLPVMYHNSNSVTYIGSCKHIKTLSNTLCGLVSTCILNTSGVIDESSEKVTDVVFGSSLFPEYISTCVNV